MSSPPDSRRAFFFCGRDEVRHVDLPPLLHARRNPMAVLNPRNSPYNAKGDGSTDDTIALQNCFNDAKAGGHSVLIPAGKYMHKNVLVMNGISVSGVNAVDADGPVTWLYATDVKYRAISFRGT